MSHVWVARESFHSFANLHLSPIKCLSLQLFKVGRWITARILFKIKNKTKILSPYKHNRERGSKRGEQRLTLHHQAMVAAKKITSRKTKDCDERMSANYLKQQLHQSFWTVTCEVTAGMFDVIWWKLTELEFSFLFFFPFSSFSCGSSPCFHCVFTSRWQCVPDA